MTATNPDFPYVRADGLLLRSAGGTEVRAHRQEDGAAIVIVWWSAGRVMDAITLRRDEAIAVGKLAGGSR